MGFSVEEYFRSEEEKDLLERERIDILAHLSDDDHDGERDDDDCIS